MIGIREWLNENQDDEIDSGTLFARVNESNGYDIISKSTGRKIGTFTFYGAGLRKEGIIFTFWGSSAPTVSLNNMEDLLNIGREIRARQESASQPTPDNGSSGE